MKIVPSITPHTPHLPPSVPAQSRVTSPVVLRPSTVSADDNGRTSTEANAALSQDEQTTSRREYAALINGLQSQATQSLERTQHLVAQYRRRLDANTRDLRRQLKNSQSQKQDPKETLQLILESCEGRSSCSSKTAIRTKTDRK
ncbi:hypothetical protein ACFQDN_22610 [Pseudomonas asuensis]